MSPTYEYPRPALTADVVLFSLRDQIVRVLLIERRSPPFAGSWALPGGFVDADEDLEPAARRELLEETGIEVGPLVQLGAIGTPGRDPRGHTVSVVFVGLDPSGRCAANAGDDASRVEWFDVRALPSLAFDHAEILARAVGFIEAWATAPRSYESLLERTATMADLASARSAILKGLHGPRAPKSGARTSSPGARGESVSSSRAAKASASSTKKSSSREGLVPASAPKTGKTPRKTR
jgi:ADP-ribose pyrophosphatase YjhB (NUDIX family)